jgi:uncharacterized membrane protein YbhN (UPF0104 family)
MSGPVDPSRCWCRAYSCDVVTVVRIARVLFIIALTFMAISFVIGLGTPSTGLLEKAVLLALIGGCVYAAAKVTTLSERLVHRLER